MSLVGYFDNIRLSSRSLASFKRDAMVPHGPQGPIVQIPLKQVRLVSPKPSLVVGSGSKTYKTLSIHVI